MLGCRCFSPSQVGDLASLGMPLFSKTDIDEYEVSGNSDFKIWDTNPVGLHCSQVGDKELKEIRYTIRKNRPNPTKDACFSVSAPLCQPDCLLCDSNVRWIYNLAVRPRGVPFPASVVGTGSTFALWVIRCMAIVG